MAYGLWEVSGSFLIPGARKRGSFGPVRISAPDRHKASEEIGKLLNVKFKGELKGGQFFTKHFATMNLNWKDMAVKATVAPVQAAQMVEAIQAQEAAAG